MTSFILITSCTSDQTGRVIEPTPINIELTRIDQILFSQDKTMKEKNDFFKENHLPFYSIYVSDLLNLGVASDPALVGALKSFTSNTDIAELQKNVDREFPDLSNELSQLNSIFGRYQTAFPERSVPRFYTMISGFNSKIAVTDDALSVGLDLYLGSEHEYYAMLRYPVYKRFGLQRQFIPRDALYAWITTEFEEPESSSSFLDNMIYKGKILYALDCLFPEADDTLKIGYNQQQLNWAKAFEANLWGIFIEKKLLYSKIRSEYGNYLQEGPFTSGLDHASPPRLGEFVGWQIVRSYMNNHPEVSLGELMSIKDSQDLLNRSGYKPKR